MVADGSRQPRCYSLKRAPQHQPLGDPHLAARRAAHLRAEAPAGDGPIAGEGDARVQGLHLRQGRPCRVAAAAGRDRRPGRHAPRRNRFVRRHDEAAATAAAHRGGDPRRAPRRVADPARHHPPHPRRRLRRRIRLPRPPHRLAQPGPARGQSQAGHARSHRAFRHLDQGQSLRRVRTRSAGHPVAALELSGALAFAYWLVLPAAVHFLTNYDENLYTIQVRASYYYSFAAFMLVAIALVFELPIFVLALVRLGVLTTATLRRNRRIGYVVMVVIAIALPTIDPVSLLFEAVPLLLLYELSIWLAVLMERRWQRSSATGLAPVP